MNAIENSKLNSQENEYNHLSDSTIKHPSCRTPSQLNWFDIEEPHVKWLVTGLITSDGYAAICGKPKAGKSCLIRNLAVCVVTGQDFLGRKVELEADTGRVLYIHLDRKDKDWRVASDFKRLGINSKEQSHRLRMLSAERGDLPSDPVARTQWLVEHVLEFQPHLVVIDLLQQFLDCRNVNDYKEVLKGINTLQDEMRRIGYKGAIVATMHARKAVSQDNPADDILGSTAQRGSFGTLILLSRNRCKGTYSIMSDQTDRDDYLGEIDERVITREPDGRMRLGQSVGELEKKAIQEKMEGDITDLLLFISANPSCTIDQIVSGLRISKRRALELVKEAGELIHRDGSGVRGDPFKFTVTNADQGEIIQ